MIYILSLCLCFFLAWIYDILGCTRNKQIWYTIILVWFIIVSGFQYRVGTDIFAYIEEYNKFYKELSFDVGDVEGNRQPGWILLCYCCRQITDDFILVKLIQAIFVNIAILSFFKRESKYVFSCIFLYAISSYLLINFNILRQGFAIGFVLYSISYLKNKRYIISVFCFFMAFMFHNSAIVALMIPLFCLIKYNKKLIVLLIGFAFLLIYAMFKIDMGTLLGVILEEEYLGDGISEIGNSYVNSDRLGVQDAKIGYVIILKLSLIAFVLIYYLRNTRNIFIGGMGFLYLIFIAVSYILPIAFRFGSYFEMTFYILLSTVIIEFPQGRFRQIRYCLYIMAVMAYSLFPLKDYFRRYPNSPYRYIDQYYPYNSVLDPEAEESLDKNKIQFFNRIY